MSTTDVSGNSESTADPRSLDYAMPAEWEPHAATWLSWPHNPDTWPGAFERVEPAYRVIVEHLAASEPVIVNVLDEGHEEHVRGQLDSCLSNVRFALIPTNDAWARDHGATFVRRRSEKPSAKTAAVSWRYNAWGGKYPPFDLDERVAECMAAFLEVPCFSSALFLEGGAIESNGAGLLLTTESCVLHTNRNPSLDRRAVEQELMRFTGADAVLWLPGGDIAGDDTDGHIDNIARFVSTDTVVIPVEPDRHDANFETLAENRRALELAGERLGIRIVDLPTPDPVFYDGNRLPASYANFYVGNRVVLVPTYRCPKDDDAVETLRHWFPGREVVGVDCVDLIWGLGAIHCLTQQVPA